MAIDLIHIRAKIVCKETELEIVTPYIQSFSINKSRGTTSNFNASLKVLGENLSAVTGEVAIYAGTQDDMPLIFTGFIKKVVPSPVWDDPAYLMLNISGTDVLYRLENKRFTRRQTYSDSAWATITSVRDGLKSSRLKYAPQEPRLIPTKEGLIDENTQTLATKDNPAKLSTDRDIPSVNMEAVIGYTDSSVVGPEAE
ncbi:MAG TPA: hypothetical protein VI911_07970 [Patescibacteria group bacterium]|nr:hypothetical protein [Patescibacteria group bacterium]